MADLDNRLSDAINRFDQSQQDRYSYRQTTKALAIAAIILGTQFTRGWIFTLPSISLGLLFLITLLYSRYLNKYHKKLANELGNFPLSTVENFQFGVFADPKENLIEKIRGVTLYINYIAVVGAYCWILLSIINFLLKLYAKISI